MSWRYTHTRESLQDAQKSCITVYTTDGSSRRRRRLSRPPTRCVAGGQRERERWSEAVTAGDDAGVKGLPLER